MTDCFLVHSSEASNDLLESESDEERDIQSLSEDVSVREEDG